jgi:hypothetical protein
VIKSFRFHHIPLKMSHQNVSDLFNKISLSEEEEKECPICCETFDKYEHAAINCSKCRMSCCRSCYKTQFLNWNKPRCMFEECKHPFEQDFLASKFPKAYLDKELKDHRKTVLLDIEKAMLPAASAALGRENKAKKAIEECAKKFTVWRKVCTDFSKISSKFHAASNREVTRLSKKLLKEKYEELAKAPKIEDQALPFANQHQQTKLTQYSFRSEARKQLHPKYLTPMQYSALDELIEIDPSYSDAMHTPDEWYQIAVQNERDTRRRMTRATYIINNLHEELDIDDEGNTPAAKEKKDVFHFRCPVGECRGFLDKQYECTVCLTKCCRSCVVPKKDGEKHECKEADLESIKMIRSETKPCPSCSSRIMKISGCFIKDTPILMYDGTIKMSQYIEKGDVLIGDDGTSRIVQETVTGTDQMYTVKQDNGIDYTVNSKHKLVLKSFLHNNIIRKGKYFVLYWFDFDLNRFCKKSLHTKEEAIELSKTLHLEDKIEMTVDRFYNLDPKIRNKLFGFKTEGVEWPEKELRLDPYLFGVWIGDGINTGQDIASADKEIINYLLDWCDNNNAELVHQAPYRFAIRRVGNKWQRTAIGKGSCETCPVCPTQKCDLCDVPRIRPRQDTRSKLNPLRGVLDSYNCIQNKHIPLDFLVNSRTNRLKLLAGLIDTDGFVDKTGKRVTITQANEAITSQIAFLARSLGFVVSVLKTERKNVKIFDLEPKDYKDIYKINISGSNLEEVPTLIKRKKVVNSTYNKDYKRSKLTVTLADNSEYFGWEVNNNHRFVLPDFTCVRNCDQIFCTSCNIAFDWKTGEVDNGPIHNPHYYEWLQKTGRVDDRHLRNVNPQVNMCGRRDLTGAFATWIDDNIPYNSGFLRPHTQIETIHEIIRSATHLRYDVFNRYTVDQNKDNLKLRIRYIKNDISEKQWKIMLHKYFKAAEFNKHIQNLIVMFNDATIQTVNDMLDINPSRERVPDQLGGERKLTRQERKDKCIDLINKCLATLKTLVEYWQENTVQLCSKYDYCYHRRLNLAEFMFKTYFESLGIKPIEVKEKPKKKVNKKVDIDKSQVDSEEEESE